MSDQQIKYAVLNFGYAEDAVLGNLVFYNAGDPFTSRQEAIQILAEDLLAMYKLHTNFDDTVKECCADNSDRNFCPECGSKISESKPVVYASEFSDWMQNLLMVSLDEFGYIDSEAQTGDRNAVWEVGYSASQLVGLTDSEVLVLDEHADRELCAVLGLED